MASGRLHSDYLVIGAGAMGMAFADALIDHADVDVTLVDRRAAPGGHWHDAYPFVRLHQASQFYGVASTLLGTGSVQTTGPEAGLHERANQTEILDYYDAVLRHRLLASGRVRLLGGHELRQDGTTWLAQSSESGDTTTIEVRRRVVDATYLSPTVPSTTPPPFEVDDDVRVIAVNELENLDRLPHRFVIVGSGKTATDAIVRLLTDGVSPDRITWVRPREPWMLNRAMVQPNALSGVHLAHSTMAAAAEAGSLDELFLRLEAAGVMLRVDTTAMPTMAKAPTIGQWEIDLLRTVDDVVRLGHVRRVSRSALELTHGHVRLEPDTVVVHCAASGLTYRPRVPVWQHDAIRIQPIRVGFPCFGAALIGFIEATRDDDRERNRVCPPNVFADGLASWAQMVVQGTLASRTFMAEPDIAAWSNACALNPSRVTAPERALPDVVDASARLASVTDAGLRRLASLATNAAHGAGHRTGASTLPWLVPWPLQPE